MSLLVVVLTMVDLKGTKVPSSCASGLSCDDDDSLDRSILPCVFGVLLLRTRPFVVQKKLTQGTRLGIHISHTK